MALFMPPMNSSKYRFFGSHRHQSPFCNQHEKRYSFTELHNPDFIAIGKGYGIEGYKVTERGNLEESIQKMIDHDGPYLLEVMIEKEDNVFPMVPTGASVSDIILEP